MRHSYTDLESPYPFVEFFASRTSNPARPWIQYIHPRSLCKQSHHALAGIGGLYHGANCSKLLEPCVVLIWIGQKQRERATRKGGGRKPKEGGGGCGGREYAGLG